MMNPVLLMLFSLLLIWCCSPVESQDEGEVNYYTSLIEDALLNAEFNEGPKDASEYRPNSEKVTEFGTFDYIVIGAGSGGAVVASRLSEHRWNKVLLLEAGGPDNNFTDIPAISFYLMNTPFTWNMYTVPQSNGCLGMVDQKCAYQRGRGLGGTSIINSLNYVRGNKLDYDNWAKENPGWSYKDLLPIFLKSEDARFPYNETRYHRQGGLLSVEYERPLNREYYAYIEANLEKNRTFLDYNGPQQVGVGQVQFNTFHGRRDSTNKAFLLPASGRKNLKIKTWSYVTKININRFTKTAYGVTFSHNKKLYLARARREIILSAGTMQSPQILMLSGIGPATELGVHGIPVIHPLPGVGRNLHDHNGYLGLLFKTNVTKPFQSLRDQVKEYLQGYGDLTFAINSQAISWFQTKLETTPGYPDIEVIMVTSNNTNSIIKKFTNYNDETYNSIWADVDPTNSFTTSLLLMHPKSRGSISLQSADPYVFPLIDSNFYSDPANLDMETMYEGIQVILDLINTEAFRKINATLYPTTTHPQCKNFEFNTKDYWFCQLKQLTMPFYHPVGTCKMGRDPYYGGAVVNHKLQVHGIKKLRVADGSIMPTTMTGHTNAPIIMIGEKAAEMILNDNKC